MQWTHNTQHSILNKENGLEGLERRIRSLQDGNVPFFLLCRYSCDYTTACLCTHTHEWISLYASYTLIKKKKSVTQMSRPLPGCLLNGCGTGSFFNFPLLQNVNYRKIMTILNFRALLSTGQRGLWATERNSSSRKQEDELGQVSFLTRMVCTSFSVQAAKSIIKSDAVPQ